MSLKNTAPHAGFIGLSFVAHILALYPVMSPGVFEFGGPVIAPKVVIVDLAQQDSVAQQVAPDPRLPQIQAPTDSAPRTAVPFVKSAGDIVEEHKQVDNPPVAQLSSSAPAVESPATLRAPEQSTQQGITTNPSMPAPAIHPPLRLTEEFLRLKRETLTYLIKLRGTPVGSAKLEASSADGEFRISLKTNTTPALSAVYPVQNLIETRHIGGNFIISKIRRQEGSFRSDRGFTISLRDKSVFWADLLKRRSTTETIPTSEVLDPFSALYLLRNRPLLVGETELLHVYDGDAYAELPVEVVRAEQIHLPGKGDVQTLVLKPQLRHDAIFNRMSEMLIWVTNDEFKVPVKIETSILLGKVTAELVSAESVPLSAASLNVLNLPSN